LAAVPECVGSGADRLETAGLLANQIIVLIPKLVLIVYLR
jgi:hypothetical protein